MHGRKNIKRSRNPFTWMVVIQIAIYLDWLGPSYKFVEKSKKQTCLEITSYWIKYSVMASRTSNQVWSKGLDTGIHCKL